MELPWFAIPLFLFMAYLATKHIIPLILFFALLVMKLVDLHIAKSRRHVLPYAGGNLEAQVDTRKKRKKKVS